MLIGASLLLLGGCSRSLVQTQFIAPEFALSDLRSGPSLLVVSPEVHVNAFKKPYRALFKDSVALPTRLSQKILDSLKVGVSVTAIQAGVPVSDSALQASLLSSGSKYVVFVRSVTIEDSLTEIPRGQLPGMNGMEPSGGGTSKSCIVVLDVEILDSTLTKQYAFVVRSSADVALYAYKTALLNAVDAAARKTAWHLSGR